MVQPQVTHSQRLKMNIEENKTVKSHFSCLLSSLLKFLGCFGAIPGGFQISSSYHRKKIERKKTEWLQNHPETKKK